MKRQGHLFVPVVAFDNLMAAVRLRRPHPRPGGAPRHLRRAGSHPAGRRHRRQLRLRPTSLSLRRFVPLLIQHRLAPDTPSADAHRYLHEASRGRQEESCPWPRGCGSGRQASPFRHTYVSGVTNGYLYYTPTAEQLKYRGSAQEDSDCLVDAAWERIFTEWVEALLARL